MQLGEVLEDSGNVSKSYFVIGKRDPFLPVLKADQQVLAGILDTEHPQAVAVVLAELPPKKSSEVLGLLSEGVRVSAVGRMTSVGNMPREAKARVAETFRLVRQILFALAALGIVVALGGGAA